MFRRKLLGPAETKELVVRVLQVIFEGNPRCTACSCLMVHFNETPGCP